jgi:putative ABC transport system permease protein
MTLRGLVGHYRDRIRAHPVQEMLAGAGVAIGVALVFAVLVTNGSIKTNARALVHGIAGDARLQLVARGDDGFSAHVLQQVRGLPDVLAASPLAEQRAAIVGPNGREPVDLVGVEGSITRFNGTATSQLDPVLLRVIRGGLLLPSAVAETVGAAPRASVRRSVELELRGRTHRLDVAAVLESSVIGPVAHAAVAIAPLDRVQALARMQGRVTRILVVPKAGRDAAVQGALERIAGGRLTVAPVDRDVALIAQAAAPSVQATGLFAAIAAVCGALLVVNAMLLTAPERRRGAALLRLAAGYSTRDVAAIMLFEAAVLGTVASAAGIAVGTLLARTVLEGAPSFLSFAFALDGHVSVPPATALLVGAGGVLITCLAAAPLLLDLRRGRPLDATERYDGEAGPQLAVPARRALFAAAIGLLAAAAVTACRAPSATVPAIGLLAVGTALAIPWLCVRVADLCQRLGDRASWHALSLACEGIRARTARASTLAAMGAVAVCGCVAIEGAHRDVLRGLDRNFAEHLAGPEIWITAGRDENSLTTDGFQLGSVARRVSRVDGVQRVAPYDGGFVDLGERRAWVLAPDSGEATPIPPSQVLHGRVAVAQSRVRAGGWIAVSNVLAATQGAQLGGRFVIPTPSGTRAFRVAAITTNLGWGPGAIVMSGERYRRDWDRPDPTAVEVWLAPGTDAEVARRAIQRTFGTGSALRAQTVAARDAQFRALARDGLQRLSQISALLVVAAALSLAAGTIGAIWQRRSSLAALRLSGHLPRELLRLLLLEAAIVLMTGCAAGLAAGMLGHALLGRWLTLTTGYPAPFAIGGIQALRIAGIVLAGALPLIGLAGARAAHMRPRISARQSA